MSEQSITVWTVLVHTSDRWDRGDSKPHALFSYSAPTGEPYPGRRMAAELRAFADTLENRDAFYTIQKTLEDGGFET